MIKEHNSTASMQLTEVTEEDIEGGEETGDPASKADTETLVEGVLADLPAYDKDLYFHDDHRMNLSRLAKSVLERKNGIRLHELT
jgi:hypothetical protein